jgi:hypothetical protein
MKFNFTSTIEHFLKTAIGAFLTFTLVFQVAFYSATSAANAASMGDMGDGVRDKAGQVVDNVADSIDRTAAKIREDSKNIDIVGRTQDKVNEVKAAADKNEYRNRGKARAAIDNAGDKVRSTADDAKYAIDKGADKAEDAAKKVQAKGEDTGGNVIDNIKGFFSNK